MGALETASGATEALRLLVVDDDAALLELNRVVLTNQGYEVTTADNALAAMELLKQQPYDLVLSDINMPEMNGIEFTEAVMEIHPDLPIVLITGFGDVEMAKEAIQRGAMDFLHKPISVKNLPSVIAQNLERKRLEIRRRQQATTQFVREVAGALSIAIEAKDPFTAGHTKQVVHLCSCLAHRFDLPPEPEERLGLAAQLHDVGKICLDSYLLTKTTPLTQGERRAICELPQIGARIVGQVRSLAKVAQIILHQHERFDGQGYPEGLAGEAIPFLSRILFVAEAFDAMVNKRAYRSALPVSEALNELQRCAGTWFDPQVVETFVALIEETESGSPRCP